jgi:hypothetical protein
MMDVGSYQLHRRAVTALNQLDDDEQAQVHEKLVSLGSSPAAQWPADLARRLRSDQPLYLVPVNDSLRLIVQANLGQQPEVLDIVRQEALDFMAQAAARNGA